MPQPGTEKDQSKRSGYWLTESEGRTMITNKQDASVPRKFLQSSVEDGVGNINIRRVLWKEIHNLPVLFFQ